MCGTTRSVHTLTDETPPPPPRTLVCPECDPGQAQDCDKLALFEPNSVQSLTPYAFVARTRTRGEVAVVPVGYRQLVTWDHPPELGLFPLYQELGVPSLLR